MTNWTDDLKSLTNASRATINRRQFLILGGGLGSAGLAYAAGNSGFAHQQNAFPNVVLIVLDDQGWSEFGCYGHPVVKTPHTDRLAQKGVRFTNAFVTTTSCSAR